MKKQKFPKMKNLKGKLKMSLGQIVFPDVSGNSTKLDFSKILPADVKFRNRPVFFIFQVAISDRFLSKFLKIRPKIALQQPKFSKNQKNFILGLEQKMLNIGLFI